MYIYPSWLVPQQWCQNAPHQHTRLLPSVCRTRCLVSALRREFVSPISKRLDRKQKVKSSNTSAVILLFFLYLFSNFSSYIIRRLKTWKTVNLQSIFEAWFVAKDAIPFWLVSYHYKRTLPSARVPYALPGRRSPPWIHVTETQVHGSQTENPGFKYRCGGFTFFLKLFSNFTFWHLRRIKFWKLLIYKAFSNLDFVAKDAILVTLSIF